MCLLLTCLSWFTVTWCLHIVWDPSVKVRSEVHFQHHRQLHASHSTPAHFFICNNWMNFLLRCIDFFKVVSPLKDSIKALIFISGCSVMSLIKKLFRAKSQALSACNTCYEWAWFRGFLKLLPRFVHTDRQCCLTLKPNRTKNNITYEITLFKTTITKHFGCCKHSIAFLSLFLSAYVCLGLITKTNNNKTNIRATADQTEIQHTLENSTSRNNLKYFSFVGLQVMFVVFPNSSGILGFFKLINWETFTITLVASQSD